MRALVADDDPVTTAVLARVLHRLGLEVVSAHDGTSAWGVLEDGPATEPAIIYWSMPIDPGDGRAGVQVGVRVARLQSRLAGQVSELQEARTHLERLVSTDAL